MDSFHESPYYRDCTLYRTVKNGNHLNKFGGLEAILAIRNIQIDMKLKVTKSNNIIGGGGANTKVPDMYGVGGVFSGPKTQK